MPKKFSLVPEEYDEISLVDEGAAGSAHVLIMKRKQRLVPPKSKSKRQGRSQSNPCSTKSSSTGAKDGGKSSQRGANWQEARHARDDKGHWAQTSGESKSKYGKGGTTKAKLNRACRDKGKGSKSGPRLVTAEDKQQKRNKKKGPEKYTFKNKGRRPVRKSALSTLGF